MTITSSRMTSPDIRARPFVTHLEGIYIFHKVREVLLRINFIFVFLNFKKLTEWKIAKNIFWRNLETFKKKWPKFFSTFLNFFDFLLSRILTMTRFVWLINMTHLYDSYFWFIGMSHEFDSMIWIIYWSHIIGNIGSLKNNRSCAWPPVVLGIPWRI